MNNLMLFKGHLKGKDAVIFEKRLLAEDPVTLHGIGDKFGISRERVRQIEGRLKKKLKIYLKSDWNTTRIQDHLKILVGDVLRDGSDKLLAARTLQHDTDLLFG